MSASRLKQSTKRHNANISMAYGCEKDPNTYCYRLTNGHKHLHRIILGRGWEHTPFDVTKLSCYEKGEESMKGRKAKEKPSNAELMAFAKKWHYINLTGRAKAEYHVGYDTAKKWLNEAGLLVKQTPPAISYGLCAECGKEMKNTNDNNIFYGLAYCAECYQVLKQTPEPGGDQPDPAQNDSESAETIIPKREHFEGDCPKCGTKPYGIKGDIKLIKWIADNGEEMCYECYLKTLTEDKPEPTYTAPLMGDIKLLTPEGSHFNPETPVDKPNWGANYPLECAKCGRTDIPLMWESNGEKICHRCHIEEPEPQRKTYTINQYEADVKAGTYPLTDAMLDEIKDDRRSALSLYCERQAEESMIREWVIDIFKHHQLTRGRKMELIGRLLDWEVGA